MNNTDFEQFLSQLLETNASLDFYCDFEKIKCNVDDIAISLNTLNYLLGQQDLKQAVKKLWDRDSKVFEVLQILIANRKEQHKKVVDGDKVIEIQEYLSSVDGVVKFLEQTGLAELIVNKDIKNFVDYVFGVEVGLDTNARKNRGGENMAKAVALKFNGANIPFRSEVNSTEFEEIKYEE